MVEISPQQEGRLRSLICETLPGQFRSAVSFYKGGRKSQIFYSGCRSIVYLGNSFSRARDTFYFSKKRRIFNDYSFLDFVRNYSDWRGQGNPTCFNRKLFKIHTSLAFVLLILFLAIFNFFYFTHNYLVHYPKEFSSEWQYGYRETIKFIAENSSSYDKVHITNALGRPYIYFLFYTKYPPEKFREDSAVYEDAAGFTHVSSIGKYMFEDNLSEKVDISERNLFVDVPRNLPPKIKILKDFRRLDGSVALVAYERITSDEESK